MTGIFIVIVDLKSVRLHTLSVWIVLHQGYVVVLVCFDLMVLVLVRTLLQVRCLYLVSDLVSLLRFTEEKLLRCHALVDGHVRDGVPVAGLADHALGLTQSVEYVMILADYHLQILVLDMAHQLRYVYISVFVLQGVRGVLGVTGLAPQWIRCL
jgi:hypothetical protein